MDFYFAAGNRRNPDGVPLPGGQVVRGSDGGKGFQQLLAIVTPLGEFGRDASVWLQAQQKLPALVAAAVVREQRPRAVSTIGFEFQLDGERPGNSTAAGSIVFPSFSAKHSSRAVDPDRWRDFTPEAHLVSSNAMRRIAVKIPVIDRLDRIQPHSTKQH